MEWNTRSPLRKPSASPSSAALSRPGPPAGTMARKGTTLLLPRHCSARSMAVMVSEDSLMTITWNANHIIKHSLALQRESPYILFVPTVGKFLQTCQCFSHCDSSPLAHAITTLMPPLRGFSAEGQSSQSIRADFFKFSEKAPSASGISHPFHLSMADD